MENNCVTLETAKKLKAGGFPQDSAYVWVTGDGWAQLHSSSAVKFMPDGAYLELFAAPTAQEIADQLPKDYNQGYLEITFAGGPPEASYEDYGYDGGNQLPCSADTMAEALALLFIKLHNDKHEMAK